MAEPLVPESWIDHIRDQTMVGQYAIENTMGSRSCMLDLGFVTEVYEAVEHGCNVSFRAQQESQYHRPMFEIIEDHPDEYCFMCNPEQNIISP